MLGSEKAKKLLEKLYDCDELSVGAHGAAVLPDNQKNGHNKYADAFLKKGLYYRYYDLRRTVAFQDRGKIHAHGNISLDELFNYDYSPEGYLTVPHEEIDTSGSLRVIRLVYEKVPATQCTFVIAIPKEISTIDIEQLCSDDDGNPYPLSRLPERDYKVSQLDGDRGYVCSQPNFRHLNPKYMVGYFMESNIDSFIFNEGFYGFSINENGEPEIDFDKIHEANERAKKINEEREAKTQRLGEETISQQKDTHKKLKMRDFLKNLLDKLKNRGRGK